MELISQIIFFVFLFAAACQDGKKKSIPIWLFLVGGIAGILLSIYQKTFGIQSLLSCLPGFFLLLLSRISDESIGMGDGFFFIVSGLFFPPFFNWKLFIYGTMLAGVLCGGSYMFHRFRGLDIRNKTVPFLPFLIPVWIVMVFQ